MNQQQINILRDAVARWETYTDRGITPHQGMYCGPEGTGCALGDIGYYSCGEVGTDMLSMSRVVGHLGMSSEGVNFTRLVAEAAFFTHAVPDLIYQVNDRQHRWPIQEVKRLIEWEEAALHADQAALDAEISSDLPAMIPQLMPA